MKIFQSVRFKLTFIALFVVFIISALISWSDIQDTETRLIAEQKDKAVLLSDVIKKSIMLLMIENRWKDLQNLIESFSANNPELKEVELFEPLTGRVIASSAGAVNGRIHNASWDKFAMHDDAPFLIRKNGALFATRISPIENTPACFRCHRADRKVLGGLELEISLTTAEQLVAESKYKHLSRLLLGFVLIVIAFLVGGERLINKPLTRLSGVMKKAESGDLSVRANGTSGDEFGYLGQAFNRMIAALSVARNEIEDNHLQQAEKTAKLASLGQLISGIAHEIKNPLAGISLGIQVLQRELSGDAEKKTYIREILDHVDRLDKTIRDVLNYARPKPPQFIKTGVRQVIDRTLFLVHFDAEKQGVLINVETEGNIPEIMIDPDQMQLVFLNIVFNALQAMSPDGVLKISVSVRNSGPGEHGISAPPPVGKAVMITFLDSGHGIAAEDIAHIFDPFFTRKVKGNGLGLSISQKIVQEHGGEIVVKSEEGRGSEFIVYLPVRDGTNDNYGKDCVPLLSENDGRPQIT